MGKNANSNLISALLADARVGTFTGLVTTKRGVERGRGANRKRYGDDTVHVCIFTGFKYTGLCQRSLDMLTDIADAEIVAEATKRGIKGWNGRGKAAVEVDITLADVAAARAELEESLQKSIEGTNESTTDDVFEPLVHNGETVRGARVYKGQTPASKAAGKAPAAKEGTIYLQGLKVSSRVIEAAPNGPAPASKSAPKSVAKRLLRGRLPISKYVSYRLQPGDDFLLRAGGTAMVEAEKDGIRFTPEVQDAIKRANKAA